MRSNGSWSTSDFSIAAYLHSIGLCLTSARLRQGSRNEYEFSFDDERCECASWAIRFVNSKACRFDQAQRALKKLAFGWQGKATAGERGDWSTSDMPLAAFVLNKGVELVGFRRIHPTRREYEFYFDDSKRACQRISMAFVNSDEYRFDQSQRALKKLVFSR